MANQVKIRKGADIKLQGEAEKVISDAPIPSSFAIKPTDFQGLIPKLCVKAGAAVKAGDPLFYAKTNEHIKFTSPVSGEVAEVVRGEKRKVLEVRIIPDSTQEYAAFDVGNLSTSEDVKKTLMSSGYWGFLRQRPYDVIADPSQTPKAIFISAFDSAPLAPDYDFILHGQEDAFQAGLDAISKLTKGKVHLITRGNSTPASVFTNATGVEKDTISGPHPAGNVGIQIHHIDPINKGDVVWSINVQAVAMIGRFLKTGKVDFSKTLALAGSEIEKPRYVRTIVGASMKSLVGGQMIEGDNRIISGNVLSGQQVAEEGYLGFHDDVVTVIPEGRDPQFLGWIAPNLNKLSFSKSYMSWLMPNKVFNLSTSMNGEDRAFVMSGQYEKVFPMDIYPVYLLKAIITKDVERMEALGIYEVAPEDMALCEFGCTSKIEVQRILREGLDLAREELG